MRRKPETHGEGVAKTVRDIRRALRRRYSAGGKIGVVIAGRRGEDSIAELWRLEEALLHNSGSRRRSRGNATSLRALSACAAFPVRSSG